MIDLILFFCNSYTAVFQISQERFKVFILLAQIAFCLFNDIVIQTKLGGNGKCVTFSWNTDQQMIGRA